MQSRIGSLTESLANILIGYAVALISQIIIFEAYGVHLGLKDQAMIGVWFTLISLVRSYVLRRMFNKITIWRMNNVDRRKNASSY